MKSFYELYVSYSYFTSHAQLKVNAVQTNHTYLNQRRNHCVQCFSDDFKTVTIILANDTRAHESEYRHHIVQNFFLKKKKKPQRSYQSVSYNHIVGGRGRLRGGGVGGRRVFQLAYKFTHNHMKSAQEKDLNSYPTATPPGFCKMKGIGVIQLRRARKLFVTGQPFPSSSAFSQGRLPILISILL